MTMLELVSNNPHVCNADALAQRRDWPAGFYFTHKPFIGRGLKIGSGASYALPTNKYTPGNIGEDATVICYVGPANQPAIDVYRRNFRIMGGVQVQRNEFKRDAAGNPIPPARDGSVGIRFARTNEAPGGKSLIDSISFVGWDRAIHIADEANHITMQTPVFEHNWTCIRADHDQAFGVHLGHAHLSGYCDTIMDFERGGRWHIDYLYSNAGALVARFRNLGPNRSSGTISQLHLDSNAKGWGLVDAPEPGWLKLHCGGHVAKAAVPRADWLNYQPSATTDVRVDLFAPGQVLEGNN